MKKTVPFYFRILFALMLMGSGFNLYSQYGGGDGLTPATAFQIWTFAHLEELSQTVGDWDDYYYFKQMDNIDASATQNPGYNGGAGFSPIGNFTDQFMGYYDGNGFSITNLYINRPAENDIGLFGYGPVIISNLALTNVDITGNDYVGAMGGEIWSVDNCYTTGTVNGNSFVGGIAGYIVDALNSYSSCSVNATSDYAGGFAGSDANSFISKCYSTGNVVGNDNVGGFIGNSTGTINYCYSFGSVNGNNVVGGFAGLNEPGLIQWCYSKGLVTGTTSTGGFIGSNGATPGDAEDSFWDTETSNQLTSADGEGKTTAEMKRVGTYLTDASLIFPWDFTLAGDIWGLNGTDNSGYPFLRHEGHTPGHIWLGSLDSDWDTDGNWSEGTKPATSDIAIIPDVALDPVLASPVTVTGLTVELGGYLNLASGDQLTVTGTLKSEDAAGLVLEPDASLVNGTPYVPATVKREIAKDGKWHFLSCPIGQSLNPEICDGNFAPLPAGFPSENSTYDFFFWQELPVIPSNLNWINVKDGSGNINTSDFGNPPRFVSGRGYLVEYSSSFAGDAMKSFVGDFGVGSYFLNLTNTPGGPWSGYNLIGNPYPSSLNWLASSGWDRSALAPNSGGYDFWIWNDAVGNYGVYNSVLGEIGGPNGVSQYIPPTQGFFVKAKSGGGILTMDDNVRCHSTQAWLKSKGNVIRIGVTSSATSYSDEALIMFNSSVNGGSDKFFSFYEEAPSLYLPVNADKYSIRFLNEMESNPAIPLSFKAGKDGSYTITISNTDNFANVYLEDLKSAVTQDVKAKPNYTFAAITADDANRFLLRFTPLGVDKKQSDQDIFVYNNVLNIKDPGKAVITVYNMTGKKMTEIQTNNEPVYRLPLQFPTGYYLVNVITGKSVWSEKVFVK